MTQEQPEQKNFLDSNTHIPLYMVYAIVAALISVTAYVVKISSAQAEDSQRLDRQKDALLRHEQMFLEFSKTQNETANALHEVMGELKYLRDTRPRR